MATSKQHDSKNGSPTSLSVHDKDVINKYSGKGFVLPSGRSATKSAVSQYLDGQLTDEEIITQKELARMQRELAAKKLALAGRKAALRLTVGNVSASSKAPSERLDGQNKHRVFILLAIALIFDTLQLALAVFQLLPIVGILFIAFNYILLVISFFIFFFMWKHYEVGFAERVVGGKLSNAGRAKSLKMAQQTLIVLLPFLEALPIFPGITIKTLVTILLVREIDKQKRLNQEIQNTERRMLVLQRQAQIKTSQ